MSREFYMPIALACFLLSACSQIVSISGSDDSSDPDGTKTAYSEREYSGSDYSPCEESEESCVEIAADELVDVEGEHSETSNGKPAEAIPEQRGEAARKSSPGNTTANAGTSYGSGSIASKTNTVNSGASNSQIIIPNGVKSLFTDLRDRRTYKAIRIGQQTWMAENLNYSINPQKESWCGGENGEKQDSNCTQYGRLYYWEAAQQACPAGWRLPTTMDFNVLRNYADSVRVSGRNRQNNKLIYDIGSYLKSTEGWKYDIWNEENGNGIDALGFHGIPTGTLWTIGQTHEIRNALSETCFWTSDDIMGDGSTVKAYCLMSQKRMQYGGFESTTTTGLALARAIRCIKN